MLLEVLQRELLFVGGKGGVGKTSLSSALALARARTGVRVLVVSTDPAHSLGHLWRRMIGDEIVALARFPDGGVLDGVEIDPAATVERHLAAVRETMLRLLPEQQHGAAHAHLERARVAPGSHESAVLERIAELAEVGRRDYDLVVFDTAPSGHTLRLLALPGQLAGWTESLLRNRDRSERYAAAMRGLTGRSDAQGESEATLRRTLERRRARFDALGTALSDAARTGFVVAFVAEALPVAETLDVVEVLGALHVDVAALIANRRSPADAGELLHARRTAEDAQLERVRAQVPGTPIIEVPLIPGELTGQAVLERLAGLLLAPAL
ncbi:ArsA family ATPase [Microbacterium sp. USHLN186]|uniref:ArsA family ATPase n=1 Tax=Microbacterium sp. USHLN186 TaxID=3081286 RepID=UPI00301AA1D2